MESANESINLFETPLVEIYVTVRTIVGSRPSMHNIHQRASFIISMVLSISSDDLYSDSDIFVQIKTFSHESKSNASLHQPIERSRVNSELCGQSPNKAPILHSYAESPVSQSLQRDYSEELPCKAPLSLPPPTSSTKLPPMIPLSTVKSNFADITTSVPYDDDMLELERERPEEIRHFNFAGRLNFKLNNIKWEDIGITSKEVPQTVKNSVALLSKIDTSNKSRWIIRTIGQRIWHTDPSDYLYFMVFIQNVFPNDISPFLELENVKKQCPARKAGWLACSLLEYAFKQKEALQMITAFHDTQKTGSMADTLNTLCHRAMDLHGGTMSLDARKMIFNKFSSLFNSQEEIEHIERYIEPKYRTNLEKMLEILSEKDLKQNLPVQRFNAVITRSVGKKDKSNPSDVQAFTPRHGYDSKHKLKDCEICLEDYYTLKKSNKHATGIPEKSDNKMRRIAQVETVPLCGRCFKPGHFVKNCTEAFPWCYESRCPCCARRVDHPPVPENDSYPCPTPKNCTHCGKTGCYGPHCRNPLKASL